MTSQRKIPLIAIFICALGTPVAATGQIVDPPCGATVTGNVVLTGNLICPDRGLTVPNGANGERCGR